MFHIHNCSYVRIQTKVEFYLYRQNNTILRGDIHKRRQLLFIALSLDRMKNAEHVPREPIANPKLSAYEYKVFLKETLHIASRVRTPFGRTSLAKKST